LARNGYKLSKCFSWAEVRQQWLKIYRSLEDSKTAKGSVSVA
jgi:hypothetical protein